MLAHYQARKYVKRPILDQCARFLEPCGDLPRFIFILWSAETIKMGVFPFSPSLQSGDLLPVYDYFCDAGQPDVAFECGAHD
ncbi:hypothetical protein AFAE65S_02094 [Alcaligenes phenolicus]